MIIYIANFNLPNTSAYSHHVMKMCDALKDYTNQLCLLIPFKDKNYKFKIIKKDYILKNSFQINSFFNIKMKNFFSKLIFFLSTIFFILKNKNKFSLIITRVPSISLILSFFEIKNILEIHQEYYGIPRIFFKLLFFLNYKQKKIKFILINKKLKKKFSFIRNENSITLDDAVDTDDFKKKIIDYKKKDCVYTGSLSKGKGFEIIYEIAKRLPKINFQVYGDKRLLDKNFLEITKPKNLFINGHKKYRYIPSILSKAKILLMPYQKKVFGRSENIDLVSYMSPLKLFDYLASGTPIIASKLIVYSHILKHNRNSILLEPNNINIWVKTINDLYYNKTKLKKISRLNKNISKKYTWKIRAKK